MSLFSSGGSSPVCSRRSSCHSERAVRHVSTQRSKARVARQFCGAGSTVTHSGFVTAWESITYEAIQQRQHESSLHEALQLPL